VVVFTAMRILIVLILLVVLGIGGFFALTYKRWEGGPPAITLSREFKAVGRNPDLQMTIDDPGTGLKQVTIKLKQKDQEVVLADESLDGTEKAKSYDVGKLMREKTKLQEGPATLTITATDHALRNFNRGNQSDVTREFTVDLNPPRIEVLSSQHYINQGGSECVVYRVSDDAEVSGVQVGPHFFPGVARNGSRFALFAFAYDQPADTAVRVIARDAAGNEAIAGIQQKVFPKAFRSREIVLDDGFLNKVVPEIMSHTPDIQDQGDIVKNYVEINSKLRKQNHDTIAKLANESAQEFLWNGGFLQLSNSQVEAEFADHRTYTYQGKPVDQQDHVGFDLSVVQQTPIEAANDGKVIYADYFGIYGNTVLIDHGAGLTSLYAHMSSLDVKPGQMVKKKEIVGRSGATGLAGGDHLHFGLFIRGVPVNPTEWWDAKWINDHVLMRLN
jgi:murein DD-endopeptidase MepM/ murein hydrolase activator NlpD